MDGEDLYSTLFKDSNDNPIALTDDGTLKNIEDYDIDYLKYPTFAEMKEKNLFGKQITYQYPTIQEKKIVQDLLDKDGNPVYELDENNETIPVLDEDGNHLHDAEGNDLYKIVKEEVTAIDEQGNIIYVMNRDDNDNIIYETRKLSYYYGSEDDMNWIFNGEGVEFSVLDSNKKFIEKLIIGKDGYATSSRMSELVNGFVRETKTLNGFKIIVQGFPYTIEKNKVITINNGRPIMNYSFSGMFNIKKVNKITQSPLAGVRLDIYELTQGNKCTEADRVPENLIYSDRTDEKGEVNYSSSQERFVCVVESETLPGYIIGQEPKIVKMEFNKTAKVEFKNISLNAKLKILKVDEEGILNLKFN